jgi:serine/threonine-protein kinase HipA
MFEDQQAIVVERFDRYRTATLAAGAAAEVAVAAAAVGTADSNGAARAVTAAARAAALSELAKRQPVLRLHQEDLCQALGLLPTLKYQNEGGPSPQTIVDLLRAHSSQPQEDVTTFLGALIFNWLIAGTDGHAKNYSLLLGARGRVRLAPLYDLGSALPYPDMDQRRLKLAMKFGDTYLIRNIAARHVEQFAVTLAIDPQDLLSQARDLAARMPAAIASAGEGAKEAGLAEPTIDRLTHLLTARAARCAKVLLG